MLYGFVTCVLKCLCLLQKHGTTSKPLKPVRLDSEVKIKLFSYIIIKSFYSLWSIGHPWRASRHCCLQLSPWPRSMIFFCLLSHPVLSFATFSSVYLSFYIPEDSNLMQFFLLLLFLYIMCVQCNSIFFFLSEFSIDFWWVILHSSLFVILLVRFIFVICLKLLFTNICSVLVIWLVLFEVSQAYNNTDFTFVLNICILTSFDILRYLHTGYSWTNTLFAFLILRSVT